MSFESSKFESGVNGTIAALSRLKASLSFSGSSKGLAELDSQANQVDLSHISKSVDAIRSKFSALSVVAITALANIATQAISAGARFVKSFTLDPLIAGFHNYETQINAVQTILANTGLKGKAGLNQVNDALQQLNTYANKTVYNFSEMAKNVGTFTAAGVGLKTSVESIKGIANLAALSGSSSEQASSAMYQLSQAIAAGRVKLQDWNSVVNAGIGGKVFQKALFTTGETFGTIKNAKLGETFDQWTKAGNTFRGSLQSGWLTSKVLTTTLKGFTGDLSASQLKAEGFSAKQIADIQQIGKTANAAATNIKTMSQLTQALKEEVATAWAAVFKTVFGNIGQATSLFSKVHTVAENALTKPIYNLNKLLEGWAQLGGRAKLIDAAKTAFKDLGAVMAPIKDAFREIFPASTAKNLYNMTVSLDNFMHSLKPSAATVDGLKHTFAGLFAIFDIGKQIVSGIFTVFGEVFKSLSGGTGSVLKLTGNVGDIIVAFDQWLKRGDRLHNFFVTLGKDIAAPLRVLNNLRLAIVGAFAGITGNASAGFSKALGGVTGALPPLQKGLEGAQKVWDRFTSSFSGIGQSLQPAVQAIVKLFGQLGNDISNAVQHMNFQSINQALRTGLLGGIYLVVKKFFSGTFAKGIGGGILSNISESFESLSGSLKALQANIKANTLLKIAAAVGILAAAVVALSLIDPKRMNAAMSALAIGFGELLGAMKILTTISGATGFIKVPVIAASLVILATAIDVLVIAVKQLSGLSWEQLAKGLGAVGALLVGITRVVEPLSRNSAGMITAGLGITAIAVAMKILASAVASFGSLSWDEIGKGLTAVAVALGSIGAASKLFPAGMVQIGLGLIGVATGLKILASAVGSFGNMNWSTIAKGIGSIAASMVAIALAMKLMPPGMALQAAGLVIVGLALQGIAKAVGSFGGMSLGTLAKGIGTLAASLGILAIGLTAMTGTLAGSAALALAAAGLALLAPAIAILGRQSWTGIAKSMAVLAASMVILGAAGALLTPVAPALLALGVAMLAIGGGLALAGAGIALIGTGLAAIAISGPIAIGVLVKALIDFAAGVPKVVAAFVDNFTQIVTSIAKAAPQFVVALGIIIASIADAIVKAMPSVVAAFDAIVKGALTAIANDAPDVIKTGFNLLKQLLSGIANNITQVTDQAADIITRFLKALANKAGAIVRAGADVLASVISGIAGSIGNIISKGADVIGGFITGMGNMFSKIVDKGADAIAHVVTGLGKDAKTLLNAGGNAIGNFVTGLGNGLDDIVKAGVKAAGKFIDTIANQIPKLADSGAQAILNLLNGLSAGIRKYEPQIIKAMWNVGWSMVQGLVSGIGSIAGRVLDKITGILSGIPGAAKKLLGISSPSKVMADIGKYITMGLANGISDNGDLPQKSVDDMVSTMIDTINGIPDALTGVVNVEPTITPILDLTQVKAGADQMNSLLAPAPINPVTSSGQASSISALQSPVIADESTPSGGSKSITFQQNNYSPEALSEIEIYRQTKNQLAMARNVLAPV
jgi:tape measure domain-containing protein